jgi:hypothetical protein
MAVAVLVGLSSSTVLWTGCSEDMRMAVSAATMPPMECPTRMTRTDGSIVGEEVPAATSRSMTLLSSLGAGGVLVVEVDVERVLFGESEGGGL